MVCVGCVGGFTVRWYVWVVWVGSLWMVCLGCVGGFTMDGVSGLSLA